MSTPIKIKIRTQGKVLVNDACIWKQSKDMKLILIDMKSKYAQVAATMSGDGENDVLIEAIERTIHVDKRRKSNITCVTLPKYKGFTIFMAECIRYTCSVLLIKY